MSENEIISMYVMYVSLALGSVECHYLVVSRYVSRNDYDLNTLFSHVRIESTHLTYQVLCQQVLPLSTSGDSTRSIRPIKLHYDLYSSIQFIALLLRKTVLS